jgi:hypothetical protein
MAHEGHDGSGFRLWNRRAVVHAIAPVRAGGLAATRDGGATRSAILGTPASGG